MRYHIRLWDSEMRPRSFIKESYSPAEEDRCCATNLCRGCDQDKYKVWGSRRVTNARGMVTKAPWREVVPWLRLECGQIHQVNDRGVERRK